MNIEKTSCTESKRTRSLGIDHGVIIMIISVCCFTANTLLLKYLGATRSVNPSVALLFRAVIGAVIVLLFFRSRRPLEIKPIFRDKWLMGRGIAGLLGTAAYYVTISSLGAGKASILCNTYVLFAVLIAAVTIGESLRKMTLGWIILAFAGIILLTGCPSQGGAQAEGEGAGVMIALGGALCAATTVVLIRRLTARYSNGTIFMAQCLWIGIAVLPFAVMHLKTLERVDITVLALAGAMAACGQMLLNEGFRRLTVAVGSSIQMTWPLMTAIGGYAFFGETLTVLQLTGASLILIGTFQVSLKR